ncbi:MAG TPA: twin-arginine translocase TatA/TatE family subunit [Ktedonobacterales bacterium]|jgi:sec-independent protein translocase protein TatA|nr:twin-arginine translocase TatA/TatE family subunit [Ktedonobacterales bacterium]
MGFHWEFLIPLLLIALLFFGAKRLPEIGSAAGQTIKEFQKSIRDKDGDDQAALPPAPDKEITPR